MLEQNKRNALAMYKEFKKYWLPHNLLPLPHWWDITFLPVTVLDWCYLTELVSVHPCSSPCSAGTCPLLQT